MKKHLTLICSGLIAGIVAQSALANDGSIAFEGGVSDSTCNVSVNGQVGDATIKLPTVSSKLLKTSGATAGRTMLNFVLTGCSLADGVTKASVFYPGSKTINNDGRLDNTKVSGKTNNVDLQILDSDTNPVNLAVGVGAQSKALPITIVGNTASIRNYVEYYATGQATAGGLTAHVDYEISYE